MAGPRACTAPPAWSRGSSLALGLLLVLALGSLPWLWHGSYASTLLYAADGAIYLICARHLLRGEGYSYLGQPFVVRPPGFAVVLLPLLAILGYGAHGLTLFVYLTGVLALVLLFLLERPRLGAPVALGVCVILWATPLYPLVCNQIMSDPLGMALLFGALILERSTRRRASLPGDLVLGVLIGVAAYVRTVCVLLVPAILLARLCAALWGAQRGRERPLPFVARRLAPLVVVPWLVLLPWSLRNAAVTPDGAVEHTLFHSYSVAMWHTDMTDPASPRISWDDLVARVEARSHDIVTSLGSGFGDFGYEPREIAFCLALILAWAVVLVRRREASDFFVGGALAVTSLYFAYQPRLLLPVWALLVPCAAWLALDGLRRVASERLAQTLVSGVLFACAAWHFDPQPKLHATMEKTHAEFLEALECSRDAFASDDVLCAGQAAHFTLALDRPVLSHRRAFRDAGVPGCLAFLERHGVDGLVLNTSRRSDARLFAALEQDPRARILGEFKSWTVMRLKP